MVSVSARGGGEVFTGDLGLTEPAHADAMASIGAVMTYTTLFLEKLAAQYPRVSFLHTSPSVVRSNVVNHPEHLPWAARFFWDYRSWGGGSRMYSK